MYLFVGLGNPGVKYHLTRHNTGWLFADFCQVFFGSKASRFSFNPKFKASIAEINLPDRKIMLVKPETFMNESGRAVRKILDFYKLDPVKQLFLIHDDLDLPFGEYKINRGKGPRVHNGVNSVIKALGIEDFVRLRIGINNDCLSKIKAGGGSVADDFILDDFVQSEQEELPRIFQNALVELNKETIA